MRTLTLTENGQAREVPVQGDVTIGRLPENTIVFGSREVDERHARVTVVGAYVFVEDLESRHGTLVNGKKALRTALKKGDRIEICGAVLTYSEDDRPDPKPAPKPAPAKPAAAAAAKPGSAVRNSGSAPGAPQPATTAAKPAAPEHKAAVGETQPMPAAKPPHKPASGRAPATGASPQRIALSGSPGDLLGGVKPASDRQSALSLGASSGRLKAHPPGATGIMKSVDRAKAEEAAMKAATSARQTESQRPKPSKMSAVGLVAMVALILTVVVLALAIPHIKNWYASWKTEQAKYQAEQEALERLRSGEPKKQSDLKQISFSSLMKTPQAWKKIESLLGKPDLTPKDKILLWNGDQGSYEFQGEDLRAYYLDDPALPGKPEEKDLAAILLFDVRANGESRFLLSGYMARREIPPLKKAEPENNAGPYIYNAEGEFVGPPNPFEHPEGEAPQTPEAPPAP